MNEQTRAMYGQWAREEKDPYYRHQFHLLSMTRGQRLARWWSINRPIVVALIVVLGMAGAVLA
jgi:hypothetical protein